MVLAHDINEGIRTQDVQITENVTFDTMLLSPYTLEGLTSSGFYKPSPIQLHGIPLGKCGFDLLLEAKSGTGKTAVFTIIALEKLDLEKGLQTIILAPTREIAVQISDVIKLIGVSYKNLNVEVVIGGLSVQEDIAKFKNTVQICVGTPGRLRHLIQAHHVDVSAVRLLVLDEADKLLDKSFQADINYIFTGLPKEKQVIMSSATYPDMLKSIMKKYVQNAQHICPNSTNILLGIKQLITNVKSNSNIVKQTQYRFEELLKILSKKQFKQCLIFCNYQVRVRDLCRMLMREKWPAEQLHGQQEQTDRLDALKTLQEYKCRILVSTDLAARGIDASNVDLVINFEPPHEWQTYLHRIGRAGRFGSYGIAITILSEGQEEQKFRKIINSINSSLEIKNFWDEEKGYLNELPNSLPKLYHEIEATNDNTELLDKLTNGNVTLVRQTECFETLCNSFEKSEENKIDSFDELLNNFESHKFAKESDNECSTSTLNLQTDVPLKLNKELEENLLKIRYTISHAYGHQISKNTDKEVSSKTNLVTKFNGSNNSKTMKQYINDEEVDLESDENHIQIALLDAGLPTSFGSSKAQRRKPKQIQYSMSHCNHTKKNGKTKEFKVSKSNDTLNEQVGLSTANGSKRDEKRHSTWDNESDSSISKQLIGNNCNERRKKSSQNTKQFIDGTFKCKKDDHGVEINRYINKKYKIWYNRLKTHIEYVQMSLYISELSKM